jgi:hypothetical protein
MKPEELPAGVTMAELLQLAMNSSSHAVAEATAHHMPAQLESDVVRRLLVTAATRRHHGAVQHLTHLAVVAQQLDAATIASTLQELVAAASHQTSQSERLLSIKRLCELDAAAQLGSDAVAQLLLVALQARAGVRCINSLISLAAAAQMSSSQLAELLQAAARHHRLYEPTTSTCVLCSLPAAKEMSSEQVAAVLLTALQHRSTACARVVSEHIPAVARLTGDMLVPLMLADNGQGFAERLLTRSEQLVMVLHAAVQHASARCLNKVCWHRLPAAQALSSVQVVELLNAAVDDDEADCLCELCSVVAGVELASDQVVAVVKVAIAKHRPECLEHLCRLQAVCNLSSGTVVGLLQFSARCGSAACLEVLCGLPAAEILGSADVLDAMVAATQAEDDLGRTNCMLHLCLLRAASCLNSMQLEQLLAKAVGIDSEGCTELLRQLAAAAAELGGAAIARLVSAAEKQGAGG